MPSKCPSCKAQVLPYADNKSFPFCSPRCKLADLHSWFGAKYAVPDHSSAPPDAGGGYDDDHGGGSIPH